MDLSIATKYVPDVGGSGRVLANGRATAMGSVIAPYVRPGRADIAATNAAPSPPPSDVDIGTPVKFVGVARLVYKRGFDEAA